MKKLWKKWSEEGLRWPYLHDPVSKKPSVTLLFPYITFVMTMISVILLHLNPAMIMATTMSMVFWLISTVVYLLRKLSKAKFDLDSRSFELESDTQANKPKEESTPSPEDLTGN